MPNITRQLLAWSPWRKRNRGRLWSTWHGFLMAFAPERAKSLTRFISLSLSGCGVRGGPHSWSLLLNHPSPIWAGCQELMRELCAALEWGRWKAAQAGKFNNTVNKIFACLGSFILQYIDQLTQDLTQNFIFCPSESGTVVRFRLIKHSETVLYAWTFKLKHILQRHSPGFLAVLPQPSLSLHLHVFSLSPIKKTFFFYINSPPLCFCT